MTMRADKLLLGTLLFVGPISAQETVNEKEVDPFVETAPNPVSWDVTCEVFSIDLAEVAKLKRAGLEDPQLYQEMVKKSEAGQAGQEEFLTVRTMDGQKSTSEEISEVIYATEYEPPELPNEIGNLPDDLEKAKLLVTPAMPSAFDTRNVGSTLEVSLQAEGEKEIHIEVDLAIVSHLGRESWGEDEAKAEMPKFTSQHVTTNLSVVPDVPAMIGSVSPPAALQKEAEGKRVWLAFVTVSESKE